MTVQVDRGVGERVGEGAGGEMTQTTMYAYVNK
jgi:hypothetical protein